MMKNEINQTKEPPKRDESLVGGYYHGPSNQAGLTAREYSDMMAAWDDERYNQKYGY